MEVEVLVELNLDKKFIYYVPKDLKKDIFIGKRVLVPFRTRTLEGFIINVEKLKKDYDFELKPIIKIIDEEPVLNEELLQLGSFMAQKTLGTLVSCYQTMLPVGLKASKGTTVNKKTLTYLKLNKIKSNITNENQLRIINLLNKNELVLKSTCNKISVYGVKKLLELEIIKEIKKEKYRYNITNIKKESKPKLTNEQQLVLNKIKNNYNPYLLHGVTGSGKTEVYMRVIEKVLKNKKEAIFLVPEISLTPQMIKKFKNRFGNNIAVIHSRLSHGERYDEWRKIVRKEVQIVIGARSAVFVPFTNLGAIIIDEEHSGTYKQDNTPCYLTSDIALFRAKYHNCPVIFGSATPSIESYTRAKIGLYTLLELKNRINKTNPKIHLVNMSEEIKKKNYVLSSLLIKKITKTINRNEQVMILLNRRGYSTVLECYDCGNTFKCPNCDIPLTYHKTNNTLQCHYCNYVLNKFNICLNCGSSNLKKFGLGTQQLEEIIKKVIKGAKVIRMDVDTTTKKNSHEEILKLFESGKYNILIGTQMISKGLDFDKVTLVGMLNADKILNMPSFRSAEETFQLINQVSGRSGRSKLTGEVIIQAFNLEHYSIKWAIKNNYIDFYNEEIKIRKFLEYPPFCNLALISMANKNLDKLKKEIFKVYNYLKLKASPDVILLGPSPANLPKVANIYYYQIIIKYKNTKTLVPILKELKQISNIKININPINI